LIRFHHMPRSSTYWELGAPMVLLRFGGDPCRRVLTSAFACRWVWMMTRGVVGGVQCGHCLEVSATVPAAEGTDAHLGGQSQKQEQGVRRG
jgi:hypothetical protein